MKYSFVAATLAMATLVVTAPAPDMEMSAQIQKAENEIAALDAEMEMQWSMPLESFLLEIPEMTIEEHQAEMKKIAATFPDCAMKCVVSLTPQACGHDYDPESADYRCQCHAKAFTGAATKCMAKSCHLNLIPMLKARKIVQRVCEHEFAVEALEKDNSKRSVPPPSEIFRIGGAGLNSNSIEESYEEGSLLRSLDPTGVKHRYSHDKHHDPIVPDKPSREYPGGGVGPAEPPKDSFIFDKKNTTGMHGPSKVNHPPTFGHGPVVIPTQTAHASN